MSGGHFEYNQYKLIEMYETIQQELDEQGKEIDRGNLFNSDDYYEKYPEERYNRTWPEDIQEEFRTAIDLLKRAYVYVQRIDWLLSADDGEDSFRERLKEELEKL